MNNDGISYRPNLNWSHFKGVPDEKNFADATIYSSYYYKTNIAFNYPSVIIGNYMDPNNSYLKQEITNNIARKKLLKHEQGHFDIKEVYRIRMMDSISNVWYSSYENRNKIIDFYTRKADSLSNKYDEETNHSTIIKKQEEWNLKIDFWLDRN